jgi:hypothetical protein
MVSLDMAYRSFREVLAGLTPASAGSSILRHQTVLCLRQGRLQRFCSLPVCDLRRRGGIYIVLTTSSILY